jgi:hypothetical protein
MKLIGFTEFSADGAMSNSSTRPAASVITGSIERPEGDSDNGDLLAIAYGDSDIVGVGKVSNNDFECIVIRGQPIGIYISQKGQIVSKPVSIASNERSKEEPVRLVLFTGTIGGVVVDSKGAPVSGATVLIKRSDVVGDKKDRTGVNRPASRLILTSKEGTFDSKYLAEGVYSIVVIADGYLARNLTDQAISDSSQTLRLTIVLDPSPKLK